jgi:hypothetical protein
MAGSSNFLTWDPPLTNAESDGSYAADPTRSAGAIADQIFPSVLANKALHQMTIMAAALGQMMAAKGYTLSDADQNTLAAVLANLLTNADLATLGVITNLSLPLAVSKGGTGATSFHAAGIPQVVASVDALSQAGAITTTTIYTPAAAGQYRFSQESFIGVSSGTSTLVVTVKWTQNGTAFQFVSTQPGTTPTHGSFVVAIYPDAGTAVQYQTTWAPGGGGDTYDLHLRLERM